MINKGTLKTVVVIIVLVFFLIIALGIWSASWGKTKEEVDETIDATGVSKELPDEKIKKDTKIEDSFYKFAEILQNSKGEGCLVAHNDFPQMVKEGSLFLARLGDNTYMQLFNEKKQLVSDATISKIPCLINAKNFYDNCLKGTDCKNKNNIIETEVKIENKNIFFGDVKAELKDQNLMFQLDDKHVCFFPMKDGGFIGTGLGAICKAEDNKLIDNCIKKIEIKISTCKKEEEWLKILEEYEKNKCIINKYTCRAENLPCQCFSLGLREEKKKPETCDESKPYCYDGRFGCHEGGPDKPLYFELCQQTNPNFKLSEIPDCIVDSKCKAINIPCKCLGYGDQYEICLEEGDSYCHKNSFGCYWRSCELTN